MFGKKKTTELNLSELSGEEREVKQKKQKTKKEKQLKSEKPKKEKQLKSEKPKKEKQPKPEKPKKTKKAKKGGGRVALAYVLIAIGSLLCIRDISALSSNKVNPLSQVQAEQAAALTMEINEMESRSAELPDIDEEIMTSIKSPTAISDSLQESLESDALDCGMTILSISSFEKKNTFGVLKAGYQLEGAGDVASITEFLKKINDRDEAMLVIEVLLSEGPTITLGDGTVMKGGSQDYRIILEHTYTKGEGPEQEVGVVTENSSDSQQSHEHSFENVGWSVAPTHEFGGEKIKICSLCKEVVTEEQPLNDSAHTWGEGACGDRTCLTCGEKETEAHHYMQNWFVESEPTCYIIGYEARKCLNPDCVVEETREIPKLEHSWVTKDGREICGVCGGAKDVGLPVTTS